MSEWKTVRLGEVADSISTTHERKKEKLVFLNTSDVLFGKFLHQTYTEVSGWPGQAKKSICRDDILLSEIRPANGRWAYVNFDADDFVVSTKLMVIRAHSNRIFPRFLYHFLTSLQTISWLQHLAESRSGTFPQITFDQVAELEISLPPPADQRAIAGFLDCISDKIELNRKQNETLEAMARALFKAWFVDFEPVRAKMEGRWVRGQSLPGLPAHLFDLFPDKLVESELGEIPEGWGVKKIEDVITRLSVGKKYEQKTVLPKGIVPVLDQGKSGVIGFHNDTPSVVATSESPVVVFANHTCYMRLINFPFSAIQNVLPFIGKELPTIWVYFATIGKQSFVEYKGHWPDFVIHELAVPAENLAKDFAKITSTYLKQIWENERESLSLSQLRDTLLPKLISGELRVPAAMVEGII